MVLVAMLFMAQAASANVAGLPDCRKSQLRLSTDGRDGDFNGMSHSGVELVIRNLGPDCMVPSLPQVTLRDGRGRTLPAVRRAPPGMHPGPVAKPVRIVSGQSATIDLRWVSGPVFPSNRVVRAKSVGVTLGKVSLRAPLAAQLYGSTGQKVTFDQAMAQSSGDSASKE